MTIKRAENEWQMHQQRSKYLSNQRHKSETNTTKFYLNDERNSTSTLVDTDKTSYYDDEMLDLNNDNSVNASIDLNQTGDSSLNNIIQTLNTIEKIDQHNGETKNTLVDRNSSKNLIYQNFLSTNNNSNQINADEQTANNKINTRLKIVAIRSTPTQNLMRVPLNEPRTPANQNSDVKYDRKD